MRIGTKVVRAGLSPATQGEAFPSGVTFAGTYHAAGDPSSSPYTYERFHNPTWEHFERALGELEGGTALAFASGMAVVAAVFGTTLRPGDILVMPSDSYYTSRLLADGFFSEIGVQVRKAPTAGNAQGEFLDGAKLLICALSYSAKTPVISKSIRSAGVSPKLWFRKTTSQPARSNSSVKTY